MWVGLVRFCRRVSLCSESHMPIFRMRRGDGSEPKGPKGQRWEPVPAVLRWWSDGTAEPRRLWGTLSGRRGQGDERAARDGEERAETRDFLAQLAGLLRLLAASKHGEFRTVTIWSCSFLYIHTHIYSSVFPLPGKLACAPD